MSTYSEFIENPVSEKTVLAWVEPTQKFTLWTLDAGATYRRNTDFYIIGIREATTSLIEVNVLPLNPGEFFFDAENLEVYIRLADDGDPNTRFITGVNRICFSDTPVTLPYDLTATGDEVCYLPLLDSVTAFKQELDNQDLIGVALESSGTIKFHNGSSTFFWDQWFDKIFWENSRIRVFSWSPSLPVDENRLMFDGLVTSKQFSPLSVSLSIKDFVYNLRNKLNVPLFSDLDGTISEAVRNRPKRRIYGQVAGIQTQSIDQTLNGFPLTGTCTGAAGATTLTGTGTSFLSEVSPDDELIYFALGEEFSVRVDRVVNDTNLELADTIDVGFAAIELINKPEVPYRRKNRRHNLAGHKLRSPNTTIANVITNQLVEVVDSTDYEAEDNVLINGFTVRILNVSGNLITFYQNLPVTPAIGDNILLEPVSAVFFNKRQFVLNRDFTVINTPTFCDIVFTDLAEFNITRARLVLGASVTFTNGSRTITGAGTVFTEQFKPRDWIVSQDLTHQVWYEIVNIISETELEVRVAYAGGNFTGAARKRTVTYIDDESIVSFNSKGKEADDGTWAKTGADAVKDLMLTDANITNLSVPDFDEAAIDIKYKLSLALPLEPLGEISTVRDAVDLISTSVFGSLVTKTDWTIAFNILNQYVPPGTDFIDDCDIISWKSQSKTQIFNKTIVNHRHFDADPKEPTRKGSYNSFFESEFVNNLMGINQTLEKDLYLYDFAAAQCQAQRYLYYSRLSQSFVEVKAKMNLSLKNLNDKMYINLDRLYERFGAPNVRRKIGIISSIRRGGRNTIVGFSDLGNSFNATGRIAPDTATDFTDPLTTDDDKIKNGYILDDDLETPDPTSEAEWGVTRFG